MKILAVGSTGTLGRQIVRRALEEGHEVACYVRNREKAHFLEEWGATLYSGDLRDLTNLPDVLEGIDVVITTASSGTGNKGNTVYDIDYLANRNLIDGCKKAGVGLFIFTSIMQCDEYPQIRLMQAKQLTETYLQQSGMPYVIFRPGAFMQGLIDQYAIPILEKKPVQVMGAASPIAYISTLDIARFYTTALGRPDLWNATYSLGGTRFWTPLEVIDLCDELAGIDQAPRVSRMPLSTMRFLRKAMRFFEWTRYSADFFEFAEVVANGQPFGAETGPVAEKFGIPISELTDVEPFLKTFYQKIKQRLREKNYKAPKVRSSF